jgi:hypothetical protein
MTTRPLSSFFSVVKDYIRQIHQSAVKDLMIMMTTNDFPDIFERLKSILTGISGMQVTADDEKHYSLYTPVSSKTGKEIFLGAVMIQKNYVSFHLMPVYVYPDLLKDISPELKKHMQGKSCFNFKKPDEPLFNELAELTALGVERFRTGEWR